MHVTSNLIVISLIVKRNSGSQVVGYQPHAKPLNHTPPFNPTLHRASTVNCHCAHSSCKRPASINLKKKQ